MQPLDKIPHSYFMIACLITTMNYATIIKKVIRDTLVFFQKTETPASR